MKVPDRLKGVKPFYDVIVVGAGLAGLTAANHLATAGHSVLLLEQHYNYGGMATWFCRKGGHIFDISLHGFPVGMIKSCRKYWSREIADSIVQLKSIRFDNPQFTLETTFDQADFTRILVEHFGITPAAVKAFFQTARGMDFYDDDQRTTADLFEEFFPGRHDVWRLLMEPIAYANGSTLDDPAITYGIVFSNFMSKGVFIFRGGTDRLIRLMRRQLQANGVDLRRQCPVEKIVVEGGRVRGVVSRGREIRANAVVSNANLLKTIDEMVGLEHFDAAFKRQAKAVRLNNSSTQVYMGLARGESIKFIGDLLFTSVAEQFDSTALCAKKITSRTFSMYYPDIRPGSDRYAIVASANANYHDWADLDDDHYQRDKQHLIDETLDCLERYLPGVRAKIDHVEAATPRTFAHYTWQRAGATFGTKFEGLAVSMDLPKQITGLFHTGSVGIIMSGWLGAINYGVIVANEVDQLLSTDPSTEVSQVVL